jgi:vacuolar-type H+-ATPase subunit C/Vma6
MGRSKGIPLLESPEGGYPVDYLLARLRGRGAYLLKDWTQVLHAQDPVEYLYSTRYGGLLTEHSIQGVWIRLLKEFRWVYRQMDRGMREAFRPFFLYTELDTILKCLRYRTRKGTGERIERLLALSLLSRKLKSMLSEAETRVSLLDRVEGALTALSERYGGLREVYLDRGPVEMERRLSDVYLEDTMDEKLHPVIRGFFSYVIDARNIITAYKCLRWGMSPNFINGGDVDRARLERVVDGQDMRGVGNLIYKLTGKTPPELTPAEVSGSLQDGLMRFSRGKAREFPDAGFILYYLLRCHAEASNLSVILHGKGLERELLRGELIH